MAPPGPFTSAAIFVGALIGCPFVYDQFKNPTSQDRISAAVDSLKDKLHVNAPTTSPPAAAVIKEEAVRVVEPKAATKAPVAPTTTPAPPKEVATPAPPTQAPPKTTTAPPKKAPTDEKWSTATPGEADDASGAASEAAAKTKQSTQSKQPSPSPKADATQSLKDFKDVIVQQLEVNAIAFDKWCSGPLLRQRLLGYLKGLEEGLEKAGFSGVLSYLEKAQAYAVSVAEGVGLSSLAASAIMSLALIADFALLGLFVVWRLCKLVGGSGSSSRQKKIDEIKKAKENGVPASPRGGPNASPKNGAKSPPKTPNSGRKNRK